MIDVTSYGAVGDGVTDNTTAFQNAIDAGYNTNQDVFFPAGDYITDTISMPFDSSSVLNRGNYLYGVGMMRTRLLAKQSGTVIFDFTQPAAYKYMVGGGISNMTLDGQGMTSSVGIKIQAMWNQEFSGLEILNFTYGVQIANQGSPGDADACNHVIINNSRIHDCAYWGVFVNVATGNNETSYLSINDTTIESCGTASGAIGGGMYWRGQMLEFNESAFVTCQNRGLYIEGGSGLGSNILANNLTFENNVEKHLECWGITGMYFNNLQMYSNDTYKTTYGIWLNAVSSLVANVRVNSAKVRATSGNNPNYAFYAAGTNLDTASVVADDKQVRWDNYGYTGQTKYTGWTVV